MKRLISYRPGAEQLAWAANLERINQAAADGWSYEPHDAVGPVEPRRELEAAAFRYDRIFNDGRWDRGGRFYAYFHSLRRTERASLQFRGEPTVELDFSGYHTHMCYSLEGLELTRKAYYVAGISPENRPAAKLALNVIYNVRPDQSAVRTLTRSLEDETIKLDGISVEALVGYLRDSHKPIAKYFSSGVGVYLQFLDSCVAELVLLHFVERGIRCLGVHDSFVVPAVYADELRSVMEAAYRRVMQVDWVPPINCK